MRLSRYLRAPALVLCLVVSGCSTTGFIYNQLDWLIVWRLNGFFTLNEGQEDELRRIVSENLEWVRINQLPQYAGFLRAVDQDFAGPVTAEMLARRFEEMVQLMDEFLAHIAPDTARFLLALDDAQIRELMENLEEHNQELWEEYAGRTAEQRVKRRERAAIKNTQRFTGRLSGDQREFLRASMAKLHDIAPDWIEGRRAWQAEFQILMEERPPEAEYIQRLTALFLDPNYGDSDEYRAKVAVNRELILGMSAELVNGLTDKQRARMSRRFNNFARDFENLAAR